MSDLAIEVRAVSKRYRLGQRESWGDLRTALLRALSRPTRASAGRGAGTTAASPGEASDIFWALRDVSFDVRPGEVVGIVGRNGAGKSTLLKVLSRITEATSGRITLRGRVGSLLEVGTGFHPELSGRENIYLNGAILGMRRAEIQARFDEIVEFAEVEKFLETPVKRYSSGMYLRLAFAVAAHLEPDILLVDEVLAVGDASFQRKCLNKMESVGRHGRTVFFVSHNMPAITRLCPRAIMLDGGRMYRDGPSPQVVSAYLRSGLGTTAQREWADDAQAPGDGTVRLRAVRVRTSEGEISETVDIRQPVHLELDYQVLSAAHAAIPCIRLSNEDGVPVFVSQDRSSVDQGMTKTPGLYRSAVTIPGNLLSEGTLVVGAEMRAAGDAGAHFAQPEAVAFQVVDSLEGDSARGDFAGPMPGIVRPLLRWTTTVLPTGIP